MNQNAKKWVAALRSGEYKQGKHFLRYKDCFCVLGVACDLMVKEGLLKEKIDHHGIYKYGKRCKTLPREVIEWLCLDSSIGYYGKWNPFCPPSLTKDNDEGELSFYEMADIIESEPEGLFNKG